MQICHNLIEILERRIPSRDANLRQLRIQINSNMLATDYFIYLAIHSEPDSLIQILSSSIQIDFIILLLFDLLEHDLEGTPDLTKTTLHEHKKRVPSFIAG